MRILICSHNKGTFPINVNENDTLLKVKQIVKQICGFGDMLFDLCCQGEELNQLDKTISDI